MSFKLEPSTGACGARISEIDLTTAIEAETIAELRNAWLEHHVLVFPNQSLSDDDLERFTTCFGDFGDDPFIKPIEDREHIIAVCRRADEQAPIFAGVWHTDWSFQQVPPAGTCLFAITIPPSGGDTWFADQHKALEQMPDDLRQRLEGKTALHSASGAYAPDGVYGEAEKEADRSMSIVTSDEANAVQRHPLIRPHPETGQEGIYGCIGYIVGIEGMSQAESSKLLNELHDWQTREEFQYRHRWSEKMLVMWDNRSVLHKARDGYQGHERLLHRTTIADKARAA